MSSESCQMDVHTLRLPKEPYALAVAPDLVLPGAKCARVGLCRWAKGMRSPESGLRASARTEVAYVLRGRVRVETPTEILELEAGQVVSTNPAQPHSVTALEDAEVFFVLLDPI